MKKNQLTPSQFQMALHSARHTMLWVLSTISVLFSIWIYQLSAGNWLAVSACWLLLMAWVSYFIWRTSKLRLLHTSSQEYEQLFYSTQSPAWLLDPHSGDIVAVNHAACQFYGYSRQEFEDLNIFDINPAKETLQTSLQQALRREKNHFFFAHRLANGEFRDVEIYSSPIQFAGQRLLYAHVYDITQRRQAEKMLHEERQLFIAGPTVVFRWQASENWPVDYVSPNVFEQFGYCAEDFLRGGIMYGDLVHPEDVSRVGKEVQQYTALHVPHFEQEYRILHADGDYRWIYDLTMVVRDESDQATHYHGYILDITEQKTTQDALLKSEARWQFAIEGNRDGLWDWNIQTNEMFFSDQWKAILGYAPDELRASLEEWETRVHPEDRAQIERDLTEHLEGKTPYYENEHRLLDREGHYKWILDRGKVIERDAQGKPLRAIGTHTDITERKHMEAGLRVIATAFETHEAILITNPEAKIVRVNKAFSDITGYRAEEVIGRNPSFLQSGQQGKDFYQKLWRDLLETGQWQGEIWNRRKNGSIYPEWQTITAVKDDDGKIAYFVSHFQDITQRKENEARIHHLAYYDPLTELANRRLLLQNLSTAVKKAQAQQQIGVILFFDLDNFKRVNDGLGHVMGDSLLKGVAQRLTQHLDAHDTISRFGGDEFVILLDNMANTQEEALSLGQQVAQHILQSFSEPYLLDKHELHISPSIGVTLFPLESDNEEAIVKQADTAMYQAKKHGKNQIQFYQQDMDASATQRLKLEEAMYHAIKKNEFSLYYQPQINHQGGLIGAEALLRWNNVERGMVSPAEFIPLAEESGLIIPIGQWVLAHACQQLQSWERSAILPPDFQLAVNISALQFQQNNFVQQVTDLLAQYTLSASRLKLELTEGLLLQNVEDAIQKMCALRKIGVSFSIDDFGTGYSSLAYLKRLPAHQLKIDQSFVRDIHSNENDAAIVTTIIAMAQHLKLDIIAEGVENTEQLTFLENNGCLAYQGYYFSRPLPCAEFETFIQDTHALNTAA